MSCVNNMHEQYRLSDGSFFTDYRNSHEYNREIMKLLNSSLKPIFINSLSLVIKFF